MTQYRLTKRGKVVLGIFILLVLALLVKGGIYINDKTSDIEAVAPKESSEEESTNPIVTPEDSGEPVGTEEPIGTEDPVVTEEPDETEVTIDSEEPEDTTASDPDKIYTLEKLEDMKQMLFILYFEKGQSNLDEEALEQLEILMEVLKAYPEEPIVIEGHVNGYPDFTQSEEKLDLSKERSQRVLEFLMDKGIENTRITVYNFGSEVPFIRQSALQHQNDRVTVYFKNHFIKGDLNK